MNPEPAKFDVVTTRRLNAPAEQVWRALTEPELVMRWWGPTGFTCPLAQMDVRPGGVSRVVMRAPQEWGGQDYHNTWTYSQVTPPERLEYVVRFTDAAGTVLDADHLPVPAGVPAGVPHVVTLRPAGPGQTDLTMTEYGYHTAEARDMSLTGLEQCLDKLAAIFD
jgi:uncharacterized protein YndB with AHSA1/START domain